MFKYSYDGEADAIYIHLSSKPYAHGRDLDDQRRIDYADDNTPIGVELLAVSEGVNVNGLPHSDEIARILADNGITISLAVGDSRWPNYTIFFDTNRISQPHTTTEPRYAPSVAVIER